MGPLPRRKWRKLAGGFERSYGQKALRGGRSGLPHERLCLRMNDFVYDAAVLVAADRNDRRAWAEHKARLEFGSVPLVPAPVVAQVSRSPRQAQLRRFLTGCAVMPMTEQDAHEAGLLLAKTRTSDVVNAAVVAAALRDGAVILTGDPDDMRRLVSASGRKAAVVAV